MVSTITEAARALLSRRLPRSAAVAPALLVAALVLAVPGCDLLPESPRSAEGPVGALGHQSRDSTKVAAADRATKVLVIVEENRSYAQMRDKMPFLARLSDTYGYATKWTAIRHPSEPNYIAMVGGSTFGIAHDRHPRVHRHRIANASSVFDLALRAGKTAAVYAESMPANCDRSVRPSRAPTYTVHTNPWVYFPAGRAACRRHDQPLTDFARDATANMLPNVGFLIPDLTHDAHNGTMAVADHWLRTTLTPVLGSKDFKDGRLVVVVTADEDNRHAGNAVLTSVLTPALSHRVVSAPLTHYSLTRYLCEVLGVPMLKHAATAPDLKVAFGL